MITNTQYNGQTVGVFGLGKTGEATITSLVAGGATVYAWDDKARDQNAPSAAGAQLVPWEAWPWHELKALVLSPGVPLTHPKPHAVVEMAQRHNCPVIGDIELLYQACPNARYIGITGTNGKSTTTTLIGHILKQCGLCTQVGGNLGTAVLALAPQGHDGTYVIETSSYQLDLMKTVRFNIALLLNITPDHIDRHGDMEGYIAAKKHIFERQQQSDITVIAIDDDYTRTIAQELKKAGAQRIIEVSSHMQVEGGVYVQDGILYDQMGATPTQFDLRNIVTLTGRHNWQNAAASYAAVRSCGVPADQIFAAMNSFAGLRHRLQLVASVNGVRFINDSKATNADATQNALAPYDTIYWIAGGKAKAGGIESLAAYFPKIAHAFLIGEAEESFAETLTGHASFTRCGTLQSAVQKAAAMAFEEGKKDAVVLLSPACASFDQFKSFEHRGDEFCNLVSTLVGIKAYAS